MKLIYSNPTTNGSRHHVKIDKSVLLKDIKTFKNTVKGFKKSNGRSSITGHITSWHRGGGSKRLYRNIQLTNEPSNAVVIGVSYDPNRSAFISTNFDLKNKKFFNTIAINSVYPGTLLKFTKNITELKLGFRGQILRMPMGTVINNISYNKNSPSKFVRAAGTSAQIIQIDDNYAKLKLPSNSIIRVSSKAYATIGTVSNRSHYLITLGKAGRNRHLNRRPIVRGIAMNPVDHPHGGRTNGGRPSVTPWGLPTKGKFYLKTRKSKIKKHAKI